MATAVVRLRADALKGARPLIPARSAAFLLSLLLAVVAALAAGFTAFGHGVLRGPAVMNGSATGTAVSVLFGAVPILLLSMVAVRRGSVRAAFGWLGAAVYLLYNAVLFLFATPFNSLFLLYTSMFTLALWSIATTLHALRIEEFAKDFIAELPARGLAAYLVVVGIVNALAWLAAVVPAVSSSAPPAFLRGTGLATNPTYVQDLAFWIPLYLVAGAALWRQVAWGYVVSGTMLVFFVLEAAGIAVDQWFGSAADPGSTIASVTASPVFAGVALIGLIPLFLFLRAVRRPIWG
jgi:hypothetical protein